MPLSQKVEIDKYRKRFHQELHKVFADQQLNGTEEEEAALAKRILLLAGVGSNEIKSRIFFAGGVLAMSFGDITQDHFNKVWTYLDMVNCPPRLDKGIGVYKQTLFSAATLHNISLWILLEDACNTLLPEIASPKWKKIKLS
jgi:hypothetical protein